METPRVRGKTLHATLFEIERGLFRLSYRADLMEHEKHELPPYQVGTCASDARRRIEHKARACGYEAIIWDAELVDASDPHLPSELVALPQYS